MDIFNAVAGWCSILSFLGLGFTLYQVITMKGKTEACLEMLSAIKDFEILSPILKDCLESSNNNLKLAGNIIEEVKKTNSLTPDLQDKIHELINANDDLRVKIEAQLPDCGSALSSANDYLRNTLKEERYWESKIDTAKIRMEKSHKLLIGKQREITDKKERVLVQAFGNE